MYDLSRIKGCLDTRFIGQTIIQFDDLNSTLIKAKSIFDTCPDGTVVLSESQSKFKIRFGRDWFSYPYENIYLSIILKPTFENYVISKFETIASVSVCESINHMYENIKCKIKWPNDIWINQKKVCSISCNIINKKNRTEGIIISFGINVNLDDEYMDENLKQIATSIKTEIQMEADREKLIAYILNNFETYYDELINFNTIIGAVDIFTNNFMLIGEDIEIVKPGKKTARKVTVTDIDCNGCLMVVDDKGNEEIISSGDISVKYERKD
nr:biotin--[acetyl-CoA-carboxylase] ligase [Sedimentibacter sp.]